MKKDKHPKSRNELALLSLLSAAFVTVLLLAGSCRAQSVTGAVTTAGKCSPAVTGSNNKLTINCENVTKRQGDELLEILNTILSRQLDATVVLSKLDEIQSGVSSIQQQMSKRTQEEEEADRIRRTAPQIDAFLKPVEKGKVYLMIKSYNLIPFQFHYFIVKSDNTIVGGFPMSDATLYPKPGNDLFHVDKDIDLDQISDHYIELRFFFKSLSDDELHLPGHDGEIIRKYRIEPDDSLALIQ